MFEAWQPSRHCDILPARAVHDSRLLCRGRQWVLLYLCPPPLLQPSIPVLAVSIGHGRGHRACEVTGQLGHLLRQRVTGFGFVTQRVLLLLASWKPSLGTVE